MHVIFTEDGFPRWFGPEPVEGSVGLDFSELQALLPATASPEVMQWLVRDILATHMRLAGKWLPRPPDPAPEPGNGADDANGAVGSDPVSPDDPDPVEA